ncbi:hypothetical protein KUTeg_019607 [Tegillarca granosa]|uniref:Amino acid transporter n=1 Tax=Tegillarca granosa TaxID=220873 RepID=A0ABQ9EFK9_TEGGR|nr:hypothetical protein KUTeg_019607 [Tegillarca granosa]
MYDVSMWVASQSNNFGKQQEKDYNKNWEKRLKEIGIAWGGSLIMQTVIGIFTSPKAVMDGAGSVALTLIIWGGCGIFTMLAALCFVELQMFVRRDGCEYGYIHKAFGPLPAFVYTWMRMSVAEPITTAVFAVAFGNYISDAIADACGPPKVLRMLLPVLVIRMFAS